MTKKDYVLIARAIRKAVEINGTIEGQTLQVVDSLTEALKKENPKFDRVKFNEDINFPYHGER
mgnify:CR=1 FL=1